MLFGEGKKHSSELHLSKSQHSNKFEAGQVDDFAVLVPNLSPLKSLKLWHDGAGLFSAWTVDRVIVSEIGDHGRQQTLFCSIDHQPIKISNADAPVQLDGVLCTLYRITVKTGDAVGAGTDSNVVIQLFGALGHSSELPLKHTVDKKRDKFERKQEDVFEMYLPSLGKLEKLRISHDCAGMGAAWLLDYVLVAEMGDSGVAKSTMFYANRWLDKKTLKNGPCVLLGTEQSTSEIGPFFGERIPDSKLQGL
jgi:hypothetical protein